MKKQSTTENDNEKDVHRLFFWLTHFVWFWLNAFIRVLVLASYNMYFFKKRKKNGILVKGMKKKTLFII